ncbi:MAG: ribosome assembly cofactor RimP, partial [Odoribacter sp.]|nr:ribosome assembly cofactor RimP [Odoribacter sp.]
GQYRKNLGNSVEITLADNRKLTGVLKAFDAERLTVECEEKKTMEGKKKKEMVKVEKTLERKDIKQIKDIVTF